MEKPACRVLEAVVYPDTPFSVYHKNTDTNSFNLSLRLNSTKNTSKNIQEMAARLQEKVLHVLLS